MPQCIAHRIRRFLLKTGKSLKESFERGYHWIGLDGLINMETSALLVMFFLLFLPAIWASIITFLIVIGKCVIDERNGSQKETHDFICAVVGIVVGLILGVTHAVVVLL